MSETNETVTPEPAPETVVEPEVTDVPDPSAEVEKWKALSRKNEQRAKENEAAAKRLAEIEEANKSEAEKLLSRAELAEKRLAEREKADEIAALVQQVAEEKGVPVGALRGSTQEELEAHADQLLSLIPKTPSVPSNDGQGKVGERIGSGTDQLTEEDVKKLASEGRHDEIVKARSEGRLADYLNS